MIHVSKTTFTVHWLINSLYVSMYVCIYIFVRRMPFCLLFWKYCWNTRDSLTFFYLINWRSLLDEMRDLFKIVKPVQLPQVNPSTISLKGRKLHITPLIFSYFHEAPSPNHHDSVPQSHQRCTSYRTQSNVSVSMRQQCSSSWTSSNGCFTFHPITFIASNDWNRSPACLTFVTNTLVVFQRVVCHIKRNVESKWTHFH